MFCELSFNFSDDPITYVLNMSQEKRVAETLKGKMLKMLWLFSYPMAWLHALSKLYLDVLLEHGIKHFLMFPSKEQSILWFVKRKLYDFHNAWHLCYHFAIYDVLRMYLLTNIYNSLDM